MSQQDDLTIHVPLIRDGISISSSTFINARFTMQDSAGNVLVDLKLNDGIRTGSHAFYVDIPGDKVPAGMTFNELRVWLGDGKSYTLFNKQIRFDKSTIERQQP